MSDRYLTIETPGEGSVREKASRFLGFAFHAADEESAKEGIARITKAHHASRHACYAYVLGSGSEVHRMYDAGEPAGTAGAPLLRAIQQFTLTHTAVVVVRYFGGTLLGKPGLIRAYGAAARAALTAASIREEVVQEPIRFICPLARFEWLKSDLRRIDGRLTGSSFGDDCRGSALIPRDLVTHVIANWLAHGIDTVRDQPK